MPQVFGFSDERHTYFSAHTQSRRSSHDHIWLSFCPSISGLLPRISPGASWASHPTDTAAHIGLNRKSFMWMHFSLQPGRWDLNCSWGQDTNFLEKQKAVLRSQAAASELWEEGYSSGAPWVIEARGIRPSTLCSQRQLAAGLHTLGPFLVIALQISSIQM